MPETAFHLRLRPATFEDAEMVADLQTLRDPQEPSDPVLLRYWWQMTDALEKSMRQVAEHDGAAVAYIGSQHELWEPADQRFGLLRPILRSDLWSSEGYAELVAIGENWLRLEGATTAVARVREDFQNDIEALAKIGFRENRRMRTSELDLVQRRDEILQTLTDCREEMQREGVRLLPLSKDNDPDKYQKLYAMFIESEKDIPTTVPWRVLTFPEWRRFWLENPGIREDRFWVARAGDEIVGTSVLDCPVVRGIPWTAYTGTSRSVRGRGIARALKYESMAQAIQAGYTRVRTTNDADNPSILRINAEMGYQLVTPVVELHRSLDSSAPPALRATSP